MSGRGVIKKGLFMMSNNSNETSRMSNKLKDILIVSICLVVSLACIIGLFTSCYSVRGVQVSKTPSEIRYVPEGQLTIVNTDGTFRSIQTPEEFKIKYIVTYSSGTSEEVWESVDQETYVSTKVDLEGGTL